VQLWDVTSRKEIRRIEIPRNYRGTLLTPDWKALYVPFQNRRVQTVEHGGKKGRQVQYSGEIRVWDLASGKERQPLPLATGWGPAYGQLDATGRYLVCAEEESFFAQRGAEAKVKTEVWDLATGKKSGLCQNYILLWDVPGQKLERTLASLGNTQVPDGRTPWHRQAMAFSPDGKIVAVGWTPKWDEGVGKDTAPDPHDVPQPRVSLIPLDGSTPPRVLVAPHGYVGDLAFSPDGRMLAFGGAGAVHLFDLTK
jgi:WD40 repeat protein